MTKEDINTQLTHDICIEIMKLMREKIVDLEKIDEISFIEKISIIVTSLAASYCKIGKLFGLTNEHLVESIRLTVSDILEE